MPLAVAGARVVVVPSAFTARTGADHWGPLLRARAIENQVFVVAPDQFGDGVPGIPLYGHSMVVDPWGTVLASAPPGPGVVVADLDPAAQDDIRRRLPSLANRRPDVYPAG
ncbi:MAG: nitrilase-related carbon-nitrogen hydrolase [Acidimicrobiia bacterium]|nr:nitrilase-related carbon-nitrogen hydrolase [Acidimicrobiia bacterium]